MEAEEGWQEEERMPRRWTANFNPLEYLGIFESEVPLPEEVRRRYMEKIRGAHFDLLDGDGEHVKKLNQSYCFLKQLGKEELREFARLHGPGAVSEEEDNEDDEIVRALSDAMVESEEEARSPIPPPPSSYLLWTANYNPLELLGIESESPEPGDVRRNYLEKIRTVHPDQDHDDDAKLEYAMKLIQSYLTST